MALASEPMGHPPAATQGGGDGPAAEAQAKAAEVAGEAQEKARQAATQAQDRLREQFNQRSSQAASQIGSQASDLRSVGESLRQQGQDGPAKAADRMASYAERVSGYLASKDADALLADAEDLGRRQPWAMAAGGLALGFAASRFLKASSRQRFSSRAPTVSRPAGVYGRPVSTMGGNGSSSSFPAPGSGAPSTGPVI